MSITLAWDPSPDAYAVGYRIYYGTESRSYSHYPVDVGNVTEYTIKGLLRNKIYYFAVTALDIDGNESDFSPEVSTAREFEGTARLFTRERRSDSCEMQEGPGDSIEVYMAFDFLQGDFIFESDDRWLNCRHAGPFIQNDDGTLEAECLKKGPLGIFTLFRLQFSGTGNVSGAYPLAMSAEVYSIFNQECPLYSIEMEELVPAQ